MIHHKTNKYFKLANYAETFLKFSIAIRATEFISGLKLEYYGVFSWGKHIAKGKELKLSKKESEIGSALSEHVATYILVLQWDDILEKLFGKNRYTHKIDDIANSASIIHLIRNAFAHSPFSPRWELKDPRFIDKSYSVSQIISIDTSKLSGKLLDRWDYGGPLALLRLSKHLKKLIKKVIR